MNETITYNCPDCAGSLTFAPEKRALFCEFCGNYFDPEVLSRIASEVSADDSSKSPFKPVETKDFLNKVEERKNQIRRVEASEKGGLDVSRMKVNAFVCKTCGAQVVAYDSEISKFCSYCGNSSFVFDKEIDELVPDGIIPFRITEQEAVQIAKMHFVNGICLPDAINDLTVDSVHGIYMPYWIFDLDLEMIGNAKVVKAYVNDNPVYNDYSKEFKISTKVNADASHRFSNHVAEQLDPFPFRELEEFNPSYLSGFYADRRDEKIKITEEEMVKTLKRNLMDEWVSTLPNVPPRYLRETFSDSSLNLHYNTTDEKITVNDKIYALFPVYFITFKVDGKLINLLVNGSTGKLVGTIPFEKKKLFKEQIGSMLIFGGVGAAIGGLACGLVNPIWGLLMVAVAAFLAINSALRYKRKYYELESKINGKKMFNLTRRGDR